MDKIGRNDPCPCGSGKKYKRCCLASSSSSTGTGAAGFTADDRRLALEELERFVETELAREDEDAFEAFYAAWDDRREEVEKLDRFWSDLSESVYDMWFYLDYPLPAGGRVVDLFLRRRWHLSSSARRYVEGLRESTMRLYEIEDLSPGLSLTMKDVLTGSLVTVRERQGSRQLHRHELIAARVISHGPSGFPEIETGLLPIPDLIKQNVITEFSEWHQAHRRQHPDLAENELLREAPLFFHDIWLGCILDPPVPQPKNTDGEDLLVTRVRFDVVEAAGLEATLDAAQELERESEETVWLWSRPNAQGNEIVSGRIVLAGEVLELECNSSARGERGRSMLEGVGRHMIRHRSTVHENLAMELRDRIRASPGQELEPAVSAREKLPRDIEDALVLDHMARHYHEWIDLPVPALDDHTPRDAARNDALRPKLIVLLQDLEGAYHRALKAGTPAYDPSWIWTELELDSRSTPRHPPPLAHERIKSVVPGIGEVCGTVAEQVRRRPGFRDASTILSADESRTNLEIQRFLREGVDSTAGETMPMAERVRLLVNFEIHRRKVFWVEESLAYMLANTDLDLTGGEVRVPFPCFALVFTDRHTLSLAERMLSIDQASPLAGHFLRVATAYVTEESHQDKRMIAVTLAFDALGADPPYWVTHGIPLPDERPISEILDEVSPTPEIDAVNASTPLRGLLHVTINAILYATSAGVAPEFRSGAVLPREPFHKTPPVSSFEDVYFLPGKIEISQVRKLQALERVASGRQLLHRFMVRGHWRRAAAVWKDQSVRWIKPYWKGPDMAAVVERAYRLKP